MPEYKNFSDIEAHPPQPVGQGGHLSDSLNEDMLMGRGDVPIVEAPKPVKDIPDVWLNRLLPSTEPMKGIDWQKVFGRVFILNDDGVFRPVESERLVNASEKVSEFRQLKDSMPYNLATILQELTSLPLYRIHHFANTGEYLHLLFSHRQLIDVLIHVNQTMFVAHRVALACHSVYFARVFILNQHQRHKLTEVRLKNVDPITFCTILRFIYTGRLKVSKKNVRKLLRAAERLQIPAITHMCHHHLGHVPKTPGSGAEEEEVGEGQQKELDANTAQAQALNLLHSKLQDLLHSEAFLRQPVEVVERVLKHDDVVISSEMEVMKLVMAWLAYDLGPRRRHADRVMQHVRFTCMTPAEIIEATQVFNFIAYSSFCRTRVLEAVWLMTLKGYHTHDVFNCHCPKPRRHLQEPSPLFPYPEESADFGHPPFQGHTAGEMIDRQNSGLWLPSEVEARPWGYNPYNPYENVSDYQQHGDESFNNPNRGQAAAYAFPPGMPPAYQDTLHLCTQRSHTQEAHPARWHADSPEDVSQTCKPVTPASHSHNLSHSFSLPVNYPDTEQPAAYTWTNHADRGAGFPSRPARPPTDRISPCREQPLCDVSGSSVLTGRPGAPPCSASLAGKRPSSGVDASALSAFREPASFSQQGRGVQGGWLSQDESRNSNADRPSASDDRLADSAVSFARHSQPGKTLFRQSESAHLKSQHRLPSSLHLSRTHDSRPESRLSGLSDTGSAFTPDHRRLRFKPYTHTPSTSSYSRTGKQPFKSSESYSAKTQHQLPSSLPTSNMHDCRPRALVSEGPSRDNAPPSDQQPFPFRAFVDPSASKSSCRTEKSISGCFDAKSVKNHHQLPSPSQAPNTYESRPEAGVSARRYRKGNASPIGEKYIQFKTCIDPSAASLSPRTVSPIFRSSESASMKTHHLPSSLCTSKASGSRPEAVDSARQTGEENVSPLVQTRPYSKSPASRSAQNSPFQTENPQVNPPQSPRYHHDLGPEAVMRQPSKACVNPSAQNIPFTGEHPQPQRLETYGCTNQHCSPSPAGSRVGFSRSYGRSSGINLNQNVQQRPSETAARRHPGTPGGRTGQGQSAAPSHTGSLDQETSYGNVFVVPEGKVTVHKAPTFVSHARPPSRSPNPVSKVVLHPDPPPPPPKPPTPPPTPPPELEEVPLFVLHSSRFGGPGLLGDMTSIEVNFEQRPVPPGDQPENRRTTSALGGRTASNTSVASEAEFQEGDLLAVGGFVDSSQRLESSLAQKLDSGHQRWETFSEIPQTRVNFAAAFVRNKLCVCGGYDPTGKAGSRATTDTFVFDPGLKQWQTGGSMVYARAFHAVCVLSGRLFAMGGQDEEDRALKTAEVYDPEGDRWSVVSSMATCRVGASAAALKERVMLVGGYGTASASAQESYPVLDSTEWFEPDINRWRSKGSLRLPRAQACLVAVGSCLYLCGGATRQRQSRALCSIADIDRYDADADQWTRVTQLKMARHNAGATVIGTKIYIVGGVSTDINQTLRTVECYDTANKQWDTSLPELPHGAKSIVCVAFSG